MNKTTITKHPATTGTNIVLRMADLFRACEELGLDCELRVEGYQVIALIEVEHTVRWERGAYRLDGGPAFLSALEAAENIHCFEDMVNGESDGCPRV